MRQIEKKLAEEFGLTKEEIHKIIMFSYAETSRQIRSSGETYEMTGLGTLTFIPKKGRLLYNKLLNLDEVKDPELIEILNKKLNG